jgi:hypothetical protein
LNRLLQVSGVLEAPWSFANLIEVPAVIARDENWNVNTRFAEGANPYYKMVQSSITRILTATKLFLDHDFTFPTFHSLLIDRLTLG